MEAGAQLIFDIQKRCNPPKKLCFPRIHNILSMYWIVILYKPASYNAMQCTKTYSMTSTDQRMSHFQT